MIDNEDEPLIPASKDKRYTLFLQIACGVLSITTVVFAVLYAQKEFSEDRTPDRIPAPIDSTEGGTPYWLFEPRYQESFGTKALPDSADIVIIGGGYIGTSLSYWLSQLMPDSNVVLVEQRGLSSGATGRNQGGMNAPYFGEPSASQLAQYPLAEWERIPQFRLENNQLVDEYLNANPEAREATRIRRSGSVDPFRNDQQEEAKQLQAWIANLTATGRNWGNHEYFDGPECEKMAGVQSGLYSGCRYSPDSFQIWPARLVWALADSATKNGVDIQTNTRVLDVGTDVDGNKIVVTDRGDITTTRVVYATNGYTNSLLRQELRARVPVTPTRGQMLATDPHRSPDLLKPEKDSDSRGGPTINVNKDLTGDYHSQRVDGAILMGGFRWQAGGGQGDSGVTNDIAKDAEVARSLRQYLIDTYEELKDYEVDELPVSTDWTGIMGFSPDFNPQIGPVPGQASGGADTDYVAVGFSGSAMSRGFRVALGLARVIAGTSTLEDEIPAPWRSGRFD